MEEEENQPEGGTPTPETPEAIQLRMEILGAKVSELTESSCSCERCRNMCKNAPCWPTPEEAARLIRAGWGHSLMLNYWTAPDNRNIMVLHPATDGNEGGTAPFWWDDECSLYTPWGQCLLHDEQLEGFPLKPLEGRLALHDGTHEGGVATHEYIARLWDTDTGRTIVAEWCREHNVNPEHGNHLEDMTLFDLFRLFEKLGKALGA